MLNLIARRQVRQISVDVAHQPAAAVAPEPALVLDRIGKSYEQQAVVSDVSLSVRRGEFITILGPSGSGKTTTLMMIAGFVYPTTGSIKVDGRDITYMPPHLRDLGMMFQNYALFPHLSIADNVAFPLKMRRLPAAQIRQRVDQALALVQLSDHAQKFASQLSGGQQQRVALARALVYGPSLLLMDEPLAALDKSLREHMQIQIKRIQKASGVTVVYVTHDQDEALAMSDRIVVMEKGRIRVVDTPNRLYEQPESDFLAQFVGETNLLRGRVIETFPDGKARVEIAQNGHHNASASGNGPFIHATCSATAGDMVTFSIRPERIVCTANRASENAWSATVTEVIYLGDVVKYQLTLNDRADTSDAPNRAQPMTLLAKQLSSAGRPVFDTGAAVFVEWKPEDVWQLRR